MRWRDRIIRHIVVHSTDQWRSADHQRRLCERSRSKHIDHSSTSNDAVVKDAGTCELTGNSVDSSQRPQNSYSPDGWQVKIFHRHGVLHHSATRHQYSMFQCTTNRIILYVLQIFYRACGPHYCICTMSAGLSFCLSVCLSVTTSILIRSSDQNLIQMTSRVIKFCTQLIVLYRTVFLQILRE